MLKLENNRPQANEPICKKIQNYIFKFSDLLGQGNFSKVYKAHHQITNQIVAIKIIELNSLKSQKLQELLFSEIDVLKKLNHPNILRCFEVFTSNRNCYIITEICNGGDLESKLRREHHFSEQAAQPIIKDIFSGLLYLAEKNVIHRDLKVANVFLHNGRAKIADFGFAKFTKQNFKDINIGSPIYMSPQGLINNIYGPKTDIWAFGILLYELLHGETPYAQCRTQSELKYHVGIPINSKKFKPELSLQIKQIMTLCLEIDQSKRITAIELQQLPYFRRMLQKSPLRRLDSPTMTKKYSQDSSKTIGSVNSFSQQTIQRHNFLLPKQDYSAVQLTNFRDNKNKSKSPFLNENGKFDNSLGQQGQDRGFSSDKRSYGLSNNNNRQQFDSTTLQKPTSINLSNKQNNYNINKVFSTSMTFKQCVNILHYCRLIYKYVTALKCTHPSQQNQIMILSTWVLLLMEQIKRKINENGIIYQGENAYLREKKLREVTNQYTKKYNQELISSGMQLNIQVIMGHVQQFYLKIDAEIGNDPMSKWIFLGHYIVMIVECTNMMKNCYDQKSYKAFSNFKQLEVFLNKNRDVMDQQSYRVLRKKISFIRPHY